jgi:hypothetical protein
MSLPRDRIPDLSLESLGDLDGLRRGHFGEAAQVRSLERAASSVGRFSAAYQALIDADYRNFLHALLVRRRVMAASDKGKGW